uniref:Aminoacyl-transfer RNA synthetases class-II family profile domain-containing protein n=1 Tax=Spongospora subterranea TaxID=70186 RepID=A0A0H5QPZ9_9EUKA|eukprot:CRZ03501.1 hypothetical protein [Spongospora subterranea]
MKSLWRFGLGLPGRRRVGYREHSTDTLCRYVGPYRSHYLDQVQHAQPGSKITICGIVSSIRPLGHITFIILSDHSGNQVQVAWRRPPPDSSSSGVDLICRRLKLHSFCSITGEVDSNEFRMSSIDVLSTPIAKRWPLRDDTNEDVALRWRFLQLRRPELQQRLRLRSRAGHVLRCFLHDRDFVEVETPTLVASSPEGAREFLVPTRRQGHFFALAQSPQQFKQLLMMGGFERYFQFARCFRDEDGRSDRQSEFTQVDLEMAFISRREIMSLTEDMIRDLSRRLPELDLRFPERVPVLTYECVMSMFGTDKPDLRIPYMEIQHLSDGWKGIICLNADNHLNHFGNEQVLIVSNTSTNIPDGLSIPLLSAGDVMILSRNLLKLGQLRNLAAASLVNAKCLELFPTRWLWVTDFPMFEADSRGALQAVHHPFTAPIDSDAFIAAANSNDEQSLLALRAQSYDLVVNGIEIGGGSIRIHREDIQKMVFSTISSKESDFSPLLEGLHHGAPPHGGIALGFDRLLSEFPLPANSLRDAIAFPKSSHGKDLLMKSPATLHNSEQQLNPLGLCLQGHSGLKSL